MMRMTPVDVLCTVECSCVLVVTDNPVVGWPLVAGLRNCVDGKLVTFLMKTFQSINTKNESFSYRVVLIYLVDDSFDEIDD